MAIVVIILRYVMEVTMNNSKRFRVVCGAKNAAIYDLDSGNVFSINESGKNIISKYLSGQSEFNEVELDFLKQLNVLGINRDTIEYDSLLNNFFDDDNSGLRYAWLELTEKCNCNCVHCYGQWGDAEKNAHKCLGKEQWNDIIDGIYKKGGRDIQLIGGEPMLHPDFKEILIHAKETGISRIDVFTNATLIDERMAEFLKEADVSVRVSLYGHCAEVHDKITQCQGSFEKTVRGLKLLKDYDIPTRIAVILMDINENYIDEIKELITSIGHTYNGYDTIRQAVNGSQLNRCVKNIDILKIKYQTEPRFKTNRNSFFKSHATNTCWNRKLAFAASGDVFPCIFARDFKIGNINENTYDEIWDKAENPWHKTIDSIDTCKDCEYRYACGDCRPLAKSLTGNENGRFPRCTYNPYIGEWLKVEDVTVELKK